MKAKITTFLTSVSISWVLILFAFTIAGGGLNPLIWSDSIRGFCCFVMLIAATGCATFIILMDDETEKY